MKKYVYLFTLLFYFFISEALARQDFNLVALGVNGGVIDGNLSAYLLRASNETNYLALDAGTLVPGIIKGLEKESFRGIPIPIDAELNPTGHILQNHIKGYFISHAHLDHISGLIISSTDDSEKPIYALPSVIDVISTHYFNWKAWPNFSDKGTGFRLGKYSYQSLTPEKFYPVADTSLQIQLWPLSHDRYESSMALIRNNYDHYFAYFGDTGPDLVEQTDKLDKIWQVLGSKIAEEKLKGIIIEVSYANGIADKQLYGHLTPAWLMTELKNLQKYSGEKGIKGLNVIITHIKPSLRKDANVRSLVMQQLNEANSMGVQFYLLEQGQQLSF